MAAVIEFWLIVGGAVPVGSTEVAEVRRQNGRDKNTAPVGVLAWPGRVAYARHESLCPRPADTARRRR